MGIADHLRSLRLEARRDEHEVAAALGLTLEGYGDLELHDEELESALSIEQVMALARLLGTDVLGLMNETERPAPIPIGDVRSAVATRLARHPVAREALEEEINWDLGPLLDGVEEWTSVYTVEFVKSLASALGLDWRAVVAGLVRFH